MHDVYNGTVHRRQLEVQEEPVEPRGVVVGEVEPRFAAIEKVLVKAQGVGKGGELLLPGSFHHSLDLVFRVVFPVCRGVGDRENIGQGRKTECD